MVLRTPTAPRREAAVQRVPVVTEDSLLNEANACTSDRPLDTKPLAAERALLQCGRS